MYLANREFQKKSENRLNDNNNNCILEERENAFSSNERTHPNFAGARNPDFL